MFASDFSHVIASWYAGRHEDGKLTLEINRKISWRVQPAGS
jgi:hypothetical protein